LLGRGGQGAKGERRVRSGKWGEAVEMAWQG
jgi:hypothetical protein